MAEKSSERRWWWEDSEEGGYGTLATHDTRIAEGTEWTVEAPTGQVRPLDLYLEADVTDVDRQRIANSASLRVHPTSAYVGVRLKERMPTRR